MVEYRIKPSGEPPSPRAAHTAAAVGTMVGFQVSRTSYITRNIVPILKFFGFYV